MTTLIGQVAPDFALPASNGQTVRLADFQGKNIVLYFYPKDMTPGCTTGAWISVIVMKTFLDQTQLY